MAEVRCIVVTPEETALEETAEFVALPLFDGEIGIAAGHSPMIGRLGFGEMRLKAGHQTSSFYIDGGFVQVAENVVCVLTNRAIPAADVDAEVAQEQLHAARSQKAHSPELLESRERHVAQARAMLRVSRKGGGAA